MGIADSPTCQFPINAAVGIWRIRVEVGRKQTGIAVRGSQTTCTGRSTWVHVRLNGSVIQPVAGVGKGSRSSASTVCRLLGTSHWLPGRLTSPLFLVIGAFAELP